MSRPASSDCWTKAARDRYTALILQAMQDLADNPNRPGAKTDIDVAPTALFYHLRHSRERAGKPPDRVGKPRHFLVYEPFAEGVINILGLIPDVIPFDIALPRFIPER